MKTSRRTNKVGQAKASFGTGDFVRVAKYLGDPRAHREYRASFRRCAGRVLPIVGWDTTGLAWLPLGRGEVVSVSPELLRLVRRSVSGVHGAPLMSNNALERPVKHRGPRLPAARSLWPAAQLGR